MKQLIVGNRFSRGESSHPSCCSAKWAIYHTGPDLGSPSEDVSRGCVLAKPRAMLTQAHCQILAMMDHLFLIATQRHVMTLILDGPTDFGPSWNLRALSSAASPVPRPQSQLHSKMWERNRLIQNTQNHIYCVYWSWAPPYKCQALLQALLLQALLRYPTPSKPHSDNCYFRPFASLIGKDGEIGN